MSKYRNFLNNCDGIVEQAVEVSESLSDPLKYAKIENTIEAALLRFYRQRTRLYVYGSRAYGLATETSDLDIFVDVDDNGGKILKICERSTWFEFFCVFPQCRISTTTICRAIKRRGCWTRSMRRWRTAASGTFWCTFPSWWCR